MFSSMASLVWSWGYGAIQVSRIADGGGGCPIFQEKHYNCVWFNVISVTRRWVGVQIRGKTVTYIKHNATNIMTVGIPI